jgi:hypothetical protein
MECVMSEHYSAEAAKIRSLTTSMVSLLESASEEPISIGQIEQGARLLTEAYQDVLNLGSKQLVSESAPDFNASLLAIEGGYNDWRSVEGAFARTLEQAYNGYVSRDHLLADTVFAQLKYQVGDRISALHAKLHSAWKNHLGTRPWDDFLVNDRPDVDQTDLTTNVKLLMQGDHLDVEDAVEELSGPLRYAFADYLERQDDALDLMEEGLWLRPEILLANDYWQHNQEIRLVDLLAKKRGTKRAAGFAQVQNLLTGAASGARGSEYVMHELDHIRLDEKDTYYRCLMLHPSHEIRRFAANNVDIEGFWKVATPQAVPCAVILTMLERIVKSQYYDEDFQKLFFQTIHKRLFNLVSRSEVLYARGIIRIFSELPFFMEDDYFEKLETVIDYVSKKETSFCVEKGVIDEFHDQLRREKDKIGTLTSQPPTLTSVPPVVLRKLARDGHYWYDLSMHPMFKIARETIRHINSPDRALQVAKNRVVNQDVLRAIGKKRTLFNTMPAKIALLSNPRTPPTVSLGYLSDLSTSDMQNLLRSSSVHPEVRIQLRGRVRSR